METEHLKHERLGKVTALAVFASDNLSSQRLRDRGDPPRPLYVGVGRSRSRSSCRSRSRSSPFSAILLFSYRQTIKAYPQAGGAYLVTQDNFGTPPGADRRCRLAHRLHPHGLRVRLGGNRSADARLLPDCSRGASTSRSRSSRLITWGNLRGVKESGRIFAVPTYFFVVMMVVLLARRFFKLLDRRPAPRVETFELPSRDAGASDFPRPPRVRVGRRGGDRRRGDLERRAGVQAARVDERADDLDVDGRAPRGDVPRPLDPRAPSPRRSRPAREGHGHRADRTSRVRDVGRRPRRSSRCCRSGRC